MGLIVTYALMEVHRSFLGNYSEYVTEKLTIIGRTFDGRPTTTMTMTMTTTMPGHEDGHVDGHGRSHNPKH